MEKNSTYAHECKIRDFYSSHMADSRPNEIIIKREAGFTDWALRADLRTIDRDQVFREWEFKIQADYSSLGQILTYTSLIRHQLKFTHVVRGVIAAFEIPDFLVRAIQINNLGIELVTIPAWMAQAGGIPVSLQELPPIQIPQIPHLYDALSPTN